MKKNVIVSLADANYYPLLDELIDSIKQFKESENVAICILDAGLEDTQKEALLKKVDEIKPAEWDIEVPDYKVKDKEWLKSQVSRAFLPKYFPNYEKYLWIDCDAWVNDWQSVELYFKACENGKLGITQTIGPGYRITSKVNWLFGKLAIIKSQNFKHAVKSKIGYSKARKLAFAPHINIGVFSLEANSPGWSSWQKNLFQTLKAGNIFGSEGLAINMSVYIDELKTEFLPLNCNWITSNLLPKFDENKNTFVEPFLPNYKIGIMHLAAGIWKDGKDMRTNKDIKIKIENLEGGFVQKSLRFSNSLKKNKISKNWVNKQRRDTYVRQSKVDGYRARSAYKLIEIDEKFKIFKGGLTVIDIGAAPGSWSQYASKVVRNGKIISIDLKEMEPIDNTVQIKGDFTEDETQQKIKEFIVSKSDIVMSDMAVNTTGIKNIDSIQTGELCKEAMIFSKDIISNGGFFVSKIFMGGSFNEIVQLGKNIFKEVKVFKPKSSRKDSKESFIICKNLR